MSALVLSMQLSRHKPFNAVENTHKLHTLHMLATTPNCFDRKQFHPGHVTAGAVITNRACTKLLLIKHKFLEMWMMPGGHVDGSHETLLAAHREAVEETGIPGLVAANQEIFDIDTHAIPANPKKDEPEHLHFDFRHLFFAADNIPLPPSPEGLPMKWVTLEECLDTFPADGGRHRTALKVRKLAA